MYQYDPRDEEARKRAEQQHIEDEKKQRAADEEKKQRAADDEKRAAEQKRKEQQRKAKAQEAPTQQQQQQSAKKPPVEKGWAVEGYEIAAASERAKAGGAAFDAADEHVALSAALEKSGVHARTRTDETAMAEQARHLRYGAQAERGASVGGDASEESISGVVRAVRLHDVPEHAAGELRQGLGGFSLDANDERNEGKNPRAEIEIETADGQRRTVTLPYAEQSDERTSDRVDYVPPAGLEHVAEGKQIVVAAERIESIEPKTPEHELGQEISPLANRDVAEKYGYSAQAMLGDDGKPRIEYRDASERLMIEDRGDRVRIHQDDAVKASVELAKEKWPDGVTVRFGNDRTPEQRSELLQECARQGVTVKNPELKADVERAKKVVEKSDAIVEKAQATKDPDAAIKAAQAKMDEIARAPAKQAEQQPQAQAEKAQPEYGE